MKINRNIFTPLLVPALALLVQAFILSSCAGGEKQQAAPSSTGDTAQAVMCQSCSMPLTCDSLRGTLQDGSLSHDYCINCMVKGEFTANCTLDQMVEQCVSHLNEVNALTGTRMTSDEYRGVLTKLLPTLKRWKK